MKAANNLTMTTRSVFGLPGQMAAAVAVATALSLTASKVSGADSRSASVGVGPGARIFATKVYGEPDFRQLAEAGFTLIMRDTDITDPTENKSSLEGMPTYFRKAAAVGLDAAIFQGGMARAKNSEDQVVTRTGKKNYFMPQSSVAAWEAIGNTLVDWAKLSLVYRNFKMAGLDYEIYAGPDAGDGVVESYDDKTFADFFKSIGKPAPDPLPAPEARRDYLQKKGLLDPRYIDYHKEIVLREVRRIRRRIDEVNPRFQIGVYGGSMFEQAVMEGFATRAAPVVHLDSATYGRGVWDVAYDKTAGGGYTPSMQRPDRFGLKWSLSVHAQHRAAAESCAYPVVNLAGHWLNVGYWGGIPGFPEGEQYRFTVRQSFNSAAYGNGYWIWTDKQVPKPWKGAEEWINAVMKYWKEASAALDAGDFTWANRQPDITPDPNGTRPLAILTVAGATTTIWNPTTGERQGTEKASPVSLDAASAVKLNENQLRINGQAAELVDPKSGVLVKQFPAGHGLRAIAVGDADGIPGDEIVTLNAGWVRVWEPESGAELLCFRVGNDQTGLMFGRRPAPGKEN